MALKRKTPDTIKGDLTVECQGEKEKLLLTYRNLTPADYDAHVVRLNDEIGDQFKDDPNRMGKFVIEFNSQLVLLLVAEWDAEYELTIDDLREAERARPGLLHGVLRGYHQAREAHVVKN